MPFTPEKKRRKTSVLPIVRRKRREKARGLHVLRGREDPSHAEGKGGSTGSMLSCRKRERRGVVPST